MNLPRTARWYGLGEGGRSGRRAGFLLLETLIAIAIMSSVLAVLPSGVVVSRRMTEKSLSMVSARLVADAVLVSELPAESLETGLRSGTVDGFNWTAQIRPRTSLSQVARSRDWVPYDVILQVVAPDGTALTVETLRVAATRRERERPAERGENRDAGTGGAGFQSGGEP